MWGGEGTEARISTQPHRWMRPAIPGCRWTPALACDWYPAAMLAHCGPLAHSGQRELKTQGTPIVARPEGFPVLVG